MFIYAYALLEQMERHLGHLVDQLRSSIAASSSLSHSNIDSNSYKICNNNGNSKSNNSDSGNDDDQQKIAIKACKEDHQQQQLLNFAHELSRKVRRLRQEVEVAGVWGRREEGNRELNKSGLCALKITGTYHSNSFTAATSSSSSLMNNMQQQWGQGRGVCVDLLIANVVRGSVLQRLRTAYFG